MAIKEKQILEYGNDSYGGLSGRDIMAASVGLHMVLQESYLSHRVHQVRRFAEKLAANGIPVVLPAGGHAVYLDMDRFFKGIPMQPGDFGGVGFCIELLHHYGIRCVACDVEWCGVVIKWVVW